MNHGCKSQHLGKSTLQAGKHTCPFGQVGQNEEKILIRVSTTVLQNRYDLSREFILGFVESHESIPLLLATALCGNIAPKW